jgi:hypothetical protein
MPDAQPGQPYSWQIPNNGPLDVMPTGSRPMPLLLTYTTPDGHQQAPSFTGGVYVYPEGLTLDSAGHFSGTIAVKVQESYYEFKVLAHNSAGIAISPFRFILKVTA